MLTGRESGLRFSDLAGLFTGKNDTGNVVLSISQKAQQAAADALGGQRGAVVAVDTRPARSSRCTRTRRTTRNLWRVTTRSRRAGHVQRDQLRRQAGAGAHLQRDLPAGIDVQDHHERGRARHRAGDAEPAVLSRRRVDRAPGHHGPTLQLRRRVLRRQPHREPRALVQHDVRPDRPRPRRRVRARDQQLRCRRRRRPRSTSPARSGAPARRRAPSRRTRRSSPRTPSASRTSRSRRSRWRSSAAGIANGGVIMAPHVGARDPGRRRQDGEDDRDQAVEDVHHAAERASPSPT